ncbi:winged helix-turn-helix transcriptional regulator [Pseudonocardia xinjiangensis]|uniref:Helix-turn-helix transcriptional regulator n=1 Tax=Pseudonocardia xinjiangensis TaxID=75289 RepID=A0ABX1RK24_9PSEU|nr:helix-turn-helix domain-containing protein [Pseudonocardia xinjiangensis]NMH80181.1 helix-turn-helix transcriptional regulator [Pseudonocardia xinjiangensis]
MAAEHIDPTSLPGRPCALAAALELVGDRWALLAMREVFFGNHQFNQIARNTGAPRDRIAARLKSLVEAGILEQRPGVDGSRHHGYHLTEAGRALGPAILALMDWGDKWVVTEPAMRKIHGDHPLAIAMVCETCGEPADESHITREMVAPNWNLAGPLAVHAHPKGARRSAAGQE